MAEEQNQWGVQINGRYRLREGIGNFASLPREVNVIELIPAPSRLDNEKWIPGTPNIIIFTDGERTLHFNVESFINTYEVVEI